MKRRSVLLAALGALFIPAFRLKAADVPKPRLCVWASTRNTGLPGRPQRGDVIDILDTTQHPGRSVYGHPDFRIVDVNMQCDNPKRELAKWIARDDAPEGFLSWHRKFTLDLDAIERAERRRLAVDDVIVTLPGNLLVKPKLMLPDPRIIG
jgi:hypothetical protein